MEAMNSVPRLARPLVETDVAAEETEEEDSFFELEIAAPDSDTNKCRTSTSNSFESNQDVRDRNVEYDCTTVSFTITEGRSSSGRFQQLCASASPGDKLFSKRKILPIEGLHRPQSPLSQLKSAPKFRGFTFSQAKSISAAGEAETGEKQGKTRKSTESGGWKRFSWDVIQKYFRLLKPLYHKVSKDHVSSEKVAGEFPFSAAPSASPPNFSGSGKTPTGLRLKQLGKSRSARMDDSLAELQDGIQSAILHCKRSLSASRDFSPLSRCDAGSSQDEKTVD